MKIAKSEKEVQIKISSNEWFDIGIKAGWLKESKDKSNGVTYKGKHYTVNPWAVCHKNIDKNSNPDKFEKCVKDVKNKSKGK